MNYLRKRSILEKLASLKIPGALKAVLTGKEMRMIRGANSRSRHTILENLSAKAGRFSERELDLLSNVMEGKAVARLGRPQAAEALTQRTTRRGLGRQPRSRPDLPAMGRQIRESLKGKKQQYSVLAGKPVRSMSPSEQVSLLRGMPQSAVGPMDRIAKQEFSNVAQKYLSTAARG